jgi:aspartate 1-decarboxylase
MTLHDVAFRVFPAERAGAELAVAAAAARCVAGGALVLVPAAAQPVASTPAAASTPTVATVDTLASRPVSSRLLQFTVLSRR